MKPTGACSSRRSRSRNLSRWIAFTKGSNFKQSLMAILLSVVVIGGMQPVPVRAAGTPVHFPAGWSMFGLYDVGGYTTSLARYVYVNGRYEPWSPLPASLSRSAPCAAGWIYFAAPADAVANTPTQATGFHEISTQDCPLDTGWNMIADPFPVPALLPGGTVGYHWNQTQAAYEMVNIIPPGSAVWVYSPSTGSVLLRAST